MSTYAAKLTDRINTVETDSSHLGDLVAWSLRSTEATPAEWDAALASSGYDAFITKNHETPSLPTEETVLTRALEESADSKGLVVRRFGDNPTGFSVHEYGKPEDDHHRVVRMWLTDKLVADTEHPLVGVAARAVGKYRARPTYQTTDIRAWLCDELRRMRRLKLRDSGGIWYVAPIYAAKLRALDALVQALPGSGEVTIIPQFGSEGAYRYLGETAKEDLGARIGKLLREAQEWAEDARNRAESTIERRMQRVILLREELAMYAGVLSITADDLNSSLHEIEDLLRREIAG